MMKRDKAIDIVESMIKAHEVASAVGNDCIDALKAAVSDMRSMQYLNGRPCTVCNAHDRNGCGLWHCVFKESHSGRKDTDDAVKA